MLSGLVNLELARCLSEYSSLPPSLVSWVGSGNAHGRRLERTPTGCPLLSTYVCVPAGNATWNVNNLRDLIFKKKFGGQFCLFPARMSVLASVHV